ncbi:hypothetical protein TSAR_003720 [Trichomalopsis sarcophagae]|uniref:Uncharacterized protein n=1 Tax=Trichomalopsis sarcophagae TaxID=543379 RepID=A0A232FD03_9HYME|nr:hypothetical protein TSAR_003720 [Trichomalopsis sarcophagae]
MKWLRSWRLEAWMTFAYSRKDCNGRFPSCCRLMHGSSNQTITFLEIRHFAANRKYRTSMLEPFTTNVVAVFYRCNSVKSPNKVTSHVSERLTSIVSCKKDGTCDWKSLVYEFEEQVL